MAHFLLFVFVFACQLIAGFSIPKLPPPNYGDTITILSIDGGGIKGIIPATVLERLDDALKKKDKTASIAHYFDVIAGTSTGGIMTALLAAPSLYVSDTNRPPFNASEIVQFYKKNGPEIFKPSWFQCPKYDRKFLEDKSRELLNETRLSQTLTNVIIPTVDQKKLKPVIFSKYKIKNHRHLDAKLSDIALGTSAAPTIFPPYDFENDGVKFSLIDGAVAADNPAMVAVSEVIQHNKIEKKQILLLSLGTGKVKVEDSNSANNAANDTPDWGCELLWLNAHGGVIEQTSTDMIFYYLATVFPGLMPEENYLRIQEYNLDPSLNNMTNTEQENMDKLEKVGINLLGQNVQRMNVTSFEPYHLNQTNRDALDSLAEKLHKERQLRLKRKSMEKEGRPFIEPVRAPFSGSPFSRSQAT